MQWIICVWIGEPVRPFLSFLFRALFFIYLFLSYKLENVDNRCNTIIFKIMYSFLSREKIEVGLFILRRSNPT